MNRYLCGYNEGTDRLMVDPMHTFSTHEVGALYIFEARSKYIGRCWEMAVDAETIGDAIRKFLEVMRL